MATIIYPETFAGSTKPGVWEPDVLGVGFSQQTLFLASDEEGPVVATVVKYVDAHTDPAKTPVLYVHGWSDYFFNRQFARFWARRGHPFYALDLRKYGRSLRDWQSPGQVEELIQYDEELVQACRLIRQDSGGQRRQRLLLAGHSTGGLVLSLWANRHPERVAGLVLNSPWLEFQGSALMRQFASAMIDPWNILTPRRELHLPKPEYYFRSMADSEQGQWQLHPVWRPPGGFPIYPSWVKAILNGHAEIAKGLSIEAPVWTVLAAESQIWSAWQARMQQVDIVLDVQEVAARISGLGSEVTLYRQTGAMHDVFASFQPARGQAYEALSRWADGYVVA